MVAPGQLLTLLVEKPAVGGRMIARLDGQVVLVGGAVPGERVSARVERVQKGVVYAGTVAVDEPSPDRREPGMDPLCGGCLYAHIDYARQLAIKSQVLADAFGRIAHLTLPAAVPVVGSPADGYRMRARLHRGRTRLGFLRDGTHVVCDYRPTRQLLPVTCDVLDQLGEALAGVPVEAVREIEISENAEASERVVHLHAAPLAVGLSPELVASIEGLTGATMTASAGCRILTGVPHVTDRLELGDGTPLHVRRHVLAFFQGNRFLLRGLVDHVVGQIPERSLMLELYAGGGLFAVAAARARHARVTAVEGDRVSAADLAVNAQSANGAVTPVHVSVESFVGTGHLRSDVILVDPPRTGLSKEAIGGVVGLGAPRILYVACDVATLARDARRLVDAGYRLTRLDAFDLFPNTPHLEVVGVFEK